MVTHAAVPFAALIASVADLPTSALTKSHGVKDHVGDEQDQMGSCDQNEIIAASECFEVRGTRLLTLCAYVSLHVLSIAPNHLQLWPSIMTMSQANTAHQGSLHQEKGQKYESAFMASSQGLIVSLISHTHICFGARSNVGVAVTT